MSSGWLFAIAWGAFWLAVAATAVIVFWPIGNDRGKGK